MAACTSCAAASISRSSANCSVMRDSPNELVDDIAARDWIWPNCRSSGAVTRLVIVSGLAPGSSVVTSMVGKSTCGSDETGSAR